MGATADRGSMRTAGMTFCIRFARGRCVVIKVFGPEDRNYFTVILLKFRLKIDFVANPFVHGGLLRYIVHVFFHNIMQLMQNTTNDFVVHVCMYMCMFSQNWTWALSCEDIQ